MAFFKLTKESKRWHMNKLKSEKGQAMVEFVLI